MYNTSEKNMEIFSKAMQNDLSANEDNGQRNNILETNHHLKPVFEKVDTSRYFRFTVSIYSLCK